MSKDEQEDTTIYMVVVNHEEQYSIWPADRTLPLGWQSVDKKGLKEECLAYIEEVWTDMRPLSLRKKMEEMTRQQKELSLPTKEETYQSETPVRTADYRDPLVRYLSEGEHPIIVSRANKSLERFKGSVDQGYILIKFTSTNGGTELGIQLDNDRTNLSKADFENGHGNAHLEGTLTLNYVTVRCVADIDLVTLEGMGHLEVLEWPVA